MTDTDLAIVGSGFGGSVLAMIARRTGMRVTLLERGRHPRFAIGESASPLAGILIEQLADRYGLPRLRPLSAHGTWRNSYPEIACGLKRGFTFFRHERGRRYAPSGDRSNELLVAASPSDALSDTHWLRSDVDSFLVREAIALGVEYVDDVRLDGIDWTGNGDPVLYGNRVGRPLRIRAGSVVDASGPRGFLSRALGIAEQRIDAYPGTQALYVHFEGVARCGDMPDYDRADQGDRLPYPMDDAAVHHVFDGGWMWVLRFDNGLVSAGVAVEDAVAAELRLAEGAGAWARLLARYPSLAAQFVDARPTRAFTYVPHLAYRASAVAGERWALLPSAAFFADPMFSSGIPLTLLGIERLGRVLEAGTPGGRPTALSTGLTGDYARATLAEADLTTRLLAGCLATFSQFPVFAAYAMCYFVAASYGEMARRLAPERASFGFLGANDPAYAAAVTGLSPAVGHRARGEEFALEVAAALAPWNIAGLCDSSKRNWYGVDLDDTVRAAHKLGLTPPQVHEALQVVQRPLIQ